MITKENVAYALEHEVIRLADDPNGTGDTVCLIGDGWFYFDDLEASNCDPDTYKKKVSRDHIISAVLNTLQDMAKGDDVTEYLYYDFFLCEQLEMKYAVVTTYSFDPEILVRLFHSEEAAVAYVKKQVAEELRIETEENGWDAEAEISDDGWTATITTHFYEDQDDVTVFAITTDLGFGTVTGKENTTVKTEFEKRAMTEAEDKYTFRQSSQICGQTGLIGYLRADMDTDGENFYGTFFDWGDYLKTEEFKKEFDEVINSLREEGDILHNRKALANYCYSNPQSKMASERDYYGVRVDSDKYTYLLRLNPNKGDYNVYCYCYVREWLDKHMKAAEKGIRFINSNYEELFRVRDGAKIRIHYVDGDRERVCRYIDDYHVEVGDQLYHICEFAERMEQSGYAYEPIDN